MKRGSSISTALSVLLSVAVLAYVGLRLDWQSVARTLAGVAWGWLALGLLVFFANYALRTLRFRLVIYSRRLPFTRLMGVMQIYGMLNYLLPAKSGEFSYLLLVNRYLRIALPEGAATLVTARFFDFATVALFLPVVLVVFREELPMWAIWASLAFCGTVYAAGAALVVFLRRAPGPPRPDASTDPRPAGRVARIWRETIEGLRVIDRRGQYMRLWGLTILIWICIYANFYCIVRSLGVEASPFEMVVVSTLLVPLTLLPVQGVANLGTHEAGWVGAFALFGYPFDTSLGIAVGTHAILLAFVIVLGFAGLVLLIGAPGRIRALASTRGIDG